jgi:hypothetical protein
MEKHRDIRIVVDELVAERVRLIRVHTQNDTASQLPGPCCRRSADQ